MCKQKLDAAKIAETPQDAGMVDYKIAGERFRGFLTHVFVIAIFFTTKNQELF